MTGWKRGEMRSALRDRNHHYHEMVTRLMREEAKLLEVAGPAARDAIVTLASKIDQVERIGGETEKLRAERASKVATLEAASPRLSQVEELLRGARECMKWSEMASEGMHWLCLAESRFDGLGYDGPT